MYLKRELGKSLTTFKGIHFGYKTLKRSSHRYEATVGIGGNLGDVLRRFEHLFVSLKKDVRVEVLQTSLILKNPPFGFVDQKDFFNAIVVLQVSMQPRLFLDYLMRLEKKYARHRSFANAPRTLDLDIIFFQDRVIKSQKLVIPHPKWHERQSVLLPLGSLKI